MSVVGAAPILAAGAVCWRDGKSGIEVLLISRSRHEDVSLPKGKVDDRETLPRAAVREIREETGYAVTLGAPLGSTEYVIPGGRDKVVRYWAAEVGRRQLRRGRFRPSDEVDEIHWVPLAKARKRLTYDRDRDVLDRFATLVERNHHRTFAIIALRHAKAEGESGGAGDAARPLTSRGTAQADAIVSTLKAWEPRAILSSPAKRCRDTVTPLAKALRLDVKDAPALSQDAWEGGGEPPAEALDRLIGKRIAKGKTAVLCSHSPVLPAILDSVVRHVGGERDGRLTRAAILTTAEFTVLHVASAKPDSGLVAMETHSPGL
ncbi:NUDIX hydrolase [Naasia aerilata]|uniref:ADP-ribose pyrophosphatase n=1 Tax=Naasia aerilata TaxID=1162966 RepID=A0ABM8G9J4_9MICO|nr:NUDIX hydrolase [Naasia aerilata]BDZ44871.1 ADP-ribose pyrophosphatase [Naasia aerilata]